MPKPLAGHCAIRHLDAIYVIGSADAYLEVFKYNITKDDWKVLNPDLDHKDPIYDTSFGKTRFRMRVK